MITPLHDRDTLDAPGLERLIEHMLCGGVAGLFILGTTGEGPLLSYRVRRELVQRTCAQVKHRVPVLVCVTDTAYVESLAIAQHASECEADAIVAAPPYYLPLGQPELQTYYDRLATESPVPLFLYNFPALTKTRIEIETLRRALDHRRIVGIKDSSGDLNYFRSVRELMKTRSDWTLLCGPDELLAESIVAGGHGGVNGGANVFPSLYVACAKAALAGEMERARELQAKVLRVTTALYRVSNSAAAVTEGIKCALSLLGICDDAMTEPFRRLAGPQRQSIERALPSLQSLMGEHS